MMTRTCPASFAVCSRCSASTPRRTTFGSKFTLSCPFFPVFAGSFALRFRVTLVLSLSFTEDDGLDDITSLVLAFTKNTKSAGRSVAPRGRERREREKR